MSQLQQTKKQITSHDFELIKKEDIDKKIIDDSKKKLKINSSYTDLKDKKEKKLKYDYNLIEEIIETFLSKYDIDYKMEEYIFEKFGETLDKEIVFNNLDVLLGKKPDSEYQILLNYEQFLEFKNVFEKLLIESINKELEELKEKVSEEELQMYQDIYANLFEEIHLTMFDNGVQRVTLTIFHYYLKVLESYAIMYLGEKEVTNIKRAKNPLELFIRDLYMIISKNPEITRFLLTLKSLIEQWLIKYNNKTKIGDFYYDILMITPEQIIERILKYLIFTAIKNKNPLTLRAIFSSYITLIHQNLFSFYATNLSKVKVGFFKQLESLFTENFNLVFDADQNFNSSQFIMELMLFTFINKHKKVLKEDYYLFNDEFFQYFFEPNHIDSIRSFDTENFSLTDHSFIYNTFLKFTNNSFKQESYFYKVNNKFFKNNSKKKIVMVFKELLDRKLFDYFYDLFNDTETVDSIIMSISKDLSAKLNPNYLLDHDFKKIDLTSDEFYDIMDEFTTILANKIQRQK